MERQRFPKDERKGIERAVDNSWQRTMHLSKVFISRLMDGVERRRGSARQPFSIFISVNRAPILFTLHLLVYATASALLGSLGHCGHKYLSGRLHTSLLRVPSQPQQREEKKEKFVVYICNGFIWNLNGNISEKLLIETIIGLSRTPLPSWKPQIRGNALQPHTVCRSPFWHALNPYSMQHFWNPLLFASAGLSKWSLKSPVIISLS